MIIKVTAQNFLSWSELDLKIQNGVTLIDGWNEDDQTPEGSGKSAILNAISWALFGKIPKDANIDDVIKEGESSCVVQVTFDNAVIYRSRKPNDLHIVMPDDRCVRGKDMRETQVIIEDFIGLTFETFCQTIYFAQNYTKKFITANQEEKGKILSEVQDLTIFDKAGKEVRSLIKLEEDALTKLKHTHELALKDEELITRDVKTEEMRHEQTRAMHAQRIVNLENQVLAEQARTDQERLRQAEDIADVVRQIEDAKKAQAETESLKAGLMEAMSELVYDESRVNALRKSNDELLAQAGAVNSEIANIDRLVAQRAQAEAQGKRYAARYKQAMAEKDKNLAFIANPSKDCPTCGTKLEACDTSHAQAEVEKLDAEIAEIVEALTALSEQIDAQVPTKDQLNIKIAELREQRVVNDREINELQKIKDRMVKAAGHLTAFDQQLAQHAAKLARLERQLEAEKAPREIDTAKLEQLQADLSIAQQPLVIDTATLEALHAKLTTAKESQADITRITAEKRKHLSRLEELKSGFKEIKSFVFNSMLNEINARVQKYLSHLFEVPVSVRFRNEDMKIETEVKYDSVDRSLGLLSGGQFRRVSLAVDLALSDVITARKGSRVGVLILDEYFKDLSETSMEKCLALLEGRGQPVLLIEHNSVFKNIVNNSVMVRLENGTSRVEIQNN